MALTREKKQKALETLKKHIASHKSIVFADFSKVNSKDLFKLRKSLKEAGCRLKIGKKTLVRIALGRSSISFWNQIVKHIPGQLAMVFGIEDEATPAKIASQFAKSNEYFTILGGIFGKRFVDRQYVAQLASLPSRNELLAKMLGSLSAPISRFENVLQGNIKGLVTVLSKIKT